MYVYAPPAAGNAEDNSAKDIAEQIAMRPFNANVRRIPPAPDIPMDIPATTKTPAPIIIPAPIIVRWKRDNSLESSGSASCLGFTLLPSSAIIFPVYNSSVFSMSRESLMPVSSILSIILLARIMNACQYICYTNDKNPDYKRNIHYKTFLFFTPN